MKNFNSNLSIFILLFLFPIFFISFFNISCNNPNPPQPPVYPTFTPPPTAIFTPLEKPTEIIPTPTVHIPDNIWKVCFLIYKNTNLPPTIYSMSDTEIDQLKSDFYNFISMAKFLSDNLINIEGEIIVVEEAVTHVREDGWGNNSIWLSPQDASDEILPLINKYDSFICTWHKGDIYALGLGYGYRTWINDIPIGYAVITEMNAGDERQRVFLHELLHGVVQYYGLDVNLPDHPEWSGNSYDTSESTKKFFKYIMTQCISPEKYQTSIRKNASEKKPAYDKDFEFLKGKIK